MLGHSRMGLVELAISFTLGHMSQAHVLAERLGSCAMAEPWAAGLAFAGEREHRAEDRARQHA